jgi:NTP pyrophosphatase (non-canonical NTP hydrolase)
MDFQDAAVRSRKVRALYARLETAHHGHEWTPTEMVVGLNQDVGDLGRLVMAASGRWAHGSGERAELGYELAECLWWIFALADRFDIDMSAAFAGFIDERKQRLGAGRQQLAKED